MIPQTGPIYASAIRSELKQTGTWHIGSPESRKLAKRPSGLIKFSDFRGKSRSIIADKTFIMTGDRFRNNLSEQGYDEWYFQDTYGYSRLATSSRDTPLGNIDNPNWDELGLVLKEVIFIEEYSNRACYYSYIDISWYGIAPGMDNITVDINGYKFVTNYNCSDGRFTSNYDEDSNLVLMRLIFVQETEYTSAPEVVITKSDQTLQKMYNEFKAHKPMTIKMHYEYTPE